MSEIIYKQESYDIIGICMEVHRNLGAGLLEVIYKDALEIEFRENNISFDREKEFFIEYKGKILPHKFYADFVVNEDIIFFISNLEDLISAANAPCAGAFGFSDRGKHMNTDSCK